MFLRNNFLLYLTAIFIAVAVAILPKDAFANEESEKHNAHGVDYYNNGKYTEAIKEYKLTIGIEKNNARYYNNLGWVYKEMKDYPLAEENFNIAIQLNPNHSSAYRGLARMYHDQSKNDEAKKYFLLTPEKNILILNHTKMQ